MKKLFRNISIMLSLLLFTFGTVYVSNKVEGIDPGVIHSKDFYDRNLTIEFSSILMSNKNIDNFV